MSDKEGIDQRLETIEQRLSAISNQVYSLGKNIEDTNQLNNKKSKKKRYFDGFFIFYGIAVGLLTGTIGSHFASDWYGCEQAGAISGTFWSSLWLVVLAGGGFFAIGCIMWYKATKV